MLAYSLYMSIVPSELSDSADLYSIARNASYFQIETEKGLTFSEGMVDEMPVFRKAWDELTVKNKPYAYKTDTSNKNKLYDVIMSYSPVTTFFLKFVYGTETYYGYFGQVDCKINEDRSLIYVLPSMVDQYTDFIENYETDVDVFGDKNLIVNGDFDVWTNGVPYGWTVTGHVPTFERLLEKNCAALGENVILSQTANNVKANSNVLISFLFKYIGRVETRENLYFSVSLYNNTLSYQLQEDGSWTEYWAPQNIMYKSNAYAIETGDAESFDIFSIISKPTPIQGNIVIQFYGAMVKWTSPFGTVLNNNVYITDVSLKVSDMAYQSLKMVFNAEKLYYKWQEEIIEIKTGDNNWPTFVKNIKWKDRPSVDSFFNDNGSPNLLQLASTNGNAPDDGDSKYYPDWIDIFNNSTNIINMQWELCELYITVGTRIKRWPFADLVNVHGYAKFAREEAYIPEPTDGSEPQSPDGEGWVNTQKVTPENTRIWVRKPFNGIYGGDTGTWILGDKYTGDIDKGTILSVNGQNLVCSEYKYTKINYPTGSNSQTIGTGIDFRDVCRKIYRSTHQSRLNKEVYSMFFWNDSPYSDFFELEERQNYITMRQNFLNYIAVVHTSTIKQITDPTLSDSELKINFRQFFDDLKVKFPSLVWFIDENMNLHFEHERFLDRVRSYVDMTGETLPYIGNYKSYEFDTSKLYGNIVRTEVNSYYKDFKKSEEKFKKIATNKRRKDLKNELTTSYISADITGALENPSDLQNGMILVAYTINDDGQNEMITGTGQITGNDVPNGVMSNSYLLKQFGRYEGTWHNGFIDGQEADYLFSRRCKLGEDIKLKGIVHENYLFTDMGVALIKSKKLDYQNENTVCTPIYRHEDYYTIADSNDMIAYDYHYNDFLAQ